MNHLNTKLKRTFFLLEHVKYKRDVPIVGAGVVVVGVVGVCVGEGPAVGGDCVLTTEQLVSLKWMSSKPISPWKVAPLSDSILILIKHLLLKVRY